MITKVSAETMTRVAQQISRGRQWRFVVRDAGDIPIMRLQRYLRLYKKFGVDYFPKEEHMNSSDKYNLELKRMVEKHSLKRSEISFLIDAPLETVRNWLRDPSAKGYRKMPSYALELLKIKVDLELEDMRRDMD